MKKITSGQLLILAVLLNGSAYADPEDVLNLQASTSLMWDSNLFRHPDSLAVSDQVTTTALGIKLNKAYSLQRFVFESTLTDYSFQKNEFLSYTGKNVSANWLWSLTPRLHGSLASTYKESQAGFQDFGVARRNIQKVETERFGAEWEVIGRWRLLGAINRSVSKNAQDFAGDRSSTTEATEFGIKYLMPSGSALTLISRETEGSYSAPLDNVNKLNSPFRQSDQEIRFVWAATGKSRVTGTVAQIDRVHSEFSERNYSGMTGSLDFNLGLTGKFGINLGLKRSLGAYSIANASYYVSQGFNVMPVWQISGKTSLRAQYSIEMREYMGALAGPVLPEQTIKQSLLSLDWFPLRILSVSASYQQQSRQSPLSTAQFDTSMSTISANLAF